MAALKEIKARIASVRSTLKITSAMKMVASAKLHRVQGQAQAAPNTNGACRRSRRLNGGIRREGLRRRCSCRTTSADGRRRGFFVRRFAVRVVHANAVKALAQQVERLRAEGFDRVTVIPVGEKIAQAAAEAGYDTDGRFRTLVSNPACEGAAALADALMAEYAAGEADRVVLVYNHFPLDGTSDARAGDVFAAARQAKNGPAACGVHLRARGGDAPRGAAASDASARASMRCCSTARRPSRRPAPSPCRPPRTTLRSCWTTLSLTYNKRRQQAITDRTGRHHARRINIQKTYSNERNQHFFTDFGLDLRRCRPSFHGICQYASQRMRDRTSGRCVRRAVEARIFDSHGDRRFRILYERPGRFRRQRNGIPPGTEPDDLHPSENPDRHPKPA